MLKRVPDLDHLARPGPDVPDGLTQLPAAVNADVPGTFGHLEQAADRHDQEVHVHHGAHAGRDLLLMAEKYPRPAGASN